MKLPHACLILLGLLPWSIASGELPYTFNAGDPIRASELNANFQYLESLASSGGTGLLARRKLTLNYSSFVKVATVPDTATNGWVLRSVASGCSGVLLRIDNDPEFAGQADTALVLRPGESLYAKCPGTSSSGSTTISYFMFNEQ
jgi:hypothetical protein